MIQCVSCGTQVPDQSSNCSHCGAAVGATAAIPAAGDETVALPLRPSSRPPTSTSSRLSIAAVVDEGHFPAGTLVAGRYRIIGLLGRGGMGEVYRATDLTLAQSVALKFLPEDAAANERLLERFHNEVRIARQVSHPNVCRVYDLGEADGLPFLSMEYIDGEDLASLLQRIGRLPSAKALEISRKVCAGLAAAHERGVIHRDLKPHNIMLNKRGEVVIMDFGLAAVADALEGPEARNGTPAYMAPEQLRGESVTARSDLYALGLIMYELFTGKRAFDAESSADLVRMQETTRPPSINSVAADVDPAVEKVVLRCLQVDPAQRPANALAIAAALPGGDPLAAALAAGKTPSPELVAASGQTQGFALRYAAPCLVFVLGALLAYPFLMQPVSLLALAPVEFPPAVLEQKARDIAASIGYTAKPVDSAAWLFSNSEYLQYFKTKSAGAADWKRLFEAESPVRLFYRQSPRYLRAPPDGEVDSGRPAADLPGMYSVQLESRGRLRRFEAVAPYYQEPATSVAAPGDPAILFRAAGLDFSQFHEVAPAYAPSAAFDARRAWTGAYPGLAGVEVTAELASWRGKPTSFILRWPWTSAVATAEEPSDPRELAFAVFSYLLLASGILGAIIYARRNLRMGRGDRTGAFRLAGAAFVLYAFSVLIRRHVIPTADLLSFAFVDLSAGVALCGLLWLAYIALEPAVRARWPQSLITWNRLLAGQVGDPRVGSHILIAAAMSIAMRLLFVWRAHVILARGGMPSDFEPDVLMGVRGFLGADAMVLFRAIVAGAAAFFLLCGLRAVLRRDWAAAIAAAVLLTLQEGGIRNSSHLALDLPMYAGVYFLLTLILLRMGLVPAILIIFVANALERIPIGADFSAWYNPAAAAQMGLIAGIALYGFWRSQSHSSPVTSAWRFHHEGMSK